MKGRQPIQINIGYRYSRKRVYDCHDPKSGKYSRKARSSILEKLFIANELYLVGFEGSNVNLIKDEVEKNPSEIKSNMDTDQKVPLPPEAAHRLFLLRNIEIINDIFHAVYRSPDHGNKSNPMDELIYIHLSKKTNEQGFSEAYKRLSSAFPKWNGLANSDFEIVKKLIESAGLGNRRTEELLSNTKTIRARFGTETLEPLRKWSDSKAFDFLTSLKGIGPKSALCIMMYSLGRQVFPVDTHVHVISERMGFISPGLNHDQAQEALENLFPKKFRYSLHVNMIAHGRRTCKKGKPICECCNVYKFCLHYRQYYRKTVKPVEGISMADIFCGAGGASLGLTNSGFSVKFAIDNNQRALDSYYLNQIGLSFDQVILGNIESIDPDLLCSRVKSKIKLIFGGPPCQGWSHIGKNHKTGKKGADFFEDPKNTLYLQFAKYLDIFEPEYFVMENVPGLLSAHEGKYAEIIKKEFRQHQYESTTLTLNASEYGIAQNRTRVFFLGKRLTEKDDSDSALKKLDRIASLVQVRKSKKGVHSFRRETGGLPHLTAGKGSNVVRVAESTKTGCPRPQLVFNHFARRHNSRDLKIYGLLSEGEDYGDFSRKNLDEELLPYSSKSFKTKFRKIKGNDVSPAIISHLSKDANSYIHPDENRGITVREGARIQSFPDDFIFLGKGFTQFIPLGNAVPPKLAEVIGSSIIEVMR